MFEILPVKKQKSVSQVHIFSGKSDEKTLFHVTRGENGHPVKASVKIKPAKVCRGIQTGPLTF